MRAAARQRASTLGRYVSKAAQSGITLMVKLAGLPGTEVEVGLAGWLYGVMLRAPFVVSLDRDGDGKSPLEIELFTHCGQCIGEIEAGTAGTDSPAEYARLSVGTTADGIQVWCERHNCNVTHFKFEAVADERPEALEKLS